MPLKRLLAENAFNPEEVQALTAAYDSALAEMKLDSGDNPVKEQLAEAILTVASSGERDPKKIKHLALMILFRED